jgi:hypothetical protein
VHTNPALLVTDTANQTSRNRITDKIHTLKN